MPKTIHKQKGLAGESIYTDGTGKIIGTSRKGVLGGRLTA